MLLFSLSFILLLAGCAAPQLPPTVAVTPTRSPAAKPQSEYKVLNLEIGASARCMLEIELTGRIGAEDLTQMAYYLSENEGKGCAPLFIFYYLPGQERVYESAWAYSHFNPELQVKISDAGE